MQPTHGIYASKERLRVYGSQHGQGAQSCVFAVIILLSPLLPSLQQRVAKLIFLPPK